MVASQLEDTFLPMLLPPEFSFARVVARNALQKLLIHQVSILEYLRIRSKTDHRPDCAEREATYIITTGGINDPEKA